MDVCAFRHFVIVNFRKDLFSKIVENHLPFRGYPENHLPFRGFRSYPENHLPFRGYPENHFRKSWKVIFGNRGKSSILSGLS